MTETRTVENVLIDEQSLPVASGSWNFKPDEISLIQRYFLPSAVVAGLLTSAFDANAAEFSSDKVNTDNCSTTESVFQPLTHRRISIAEALRLSNQIMERAENGRRKAADEEAARAFDLELD